MNGIEHQLSAWGVTRFAAALVGVSLLAGCSSSVGTPDQESRGTGGTTASSFPGPSAASSTASASTPTHTPASAEGRAENVPLPVMPEAAKVQSKEGLEAFARHWYELLGYGYKTGNSEPVRAVTSPDCAAANSFYEAVADGYEDGSWMGGSEISIRIITSNYVLTVESRYQLEVEMFQEPLEFYETDGTFRIAYPRVNPGRQLFEASYSSNGWRVDNVVALESAPS